MTLARFKSSLYWPWFICGVGAMFYCYEYFLRISPSVMTLELMKTYDLTAVQVGGLAAFYYHAYMPMQIAVGLLMDRYGPRYLLTLACISCALGTFLFAGAHSLFFAQLGRFMVGFGSAFAFVGALKLATIWLPPNRFALISGLITTLGMVGAMAGDVMLHELVITLGWQVTSFASAVCGVLLSFVLWFFINDQNPKHYLTHVHHVSFKELIVGLVRVLKNPQIWLNGLIACLLYLSLSGFGELWGIPYLENAHGLSKAQSAKANSMIFLGWAVGGPLWGWFSDFIQSRRYILFFCGVMSFILICLLLYTPDLPVKSIYLLLFGFGLFTSVEILAFAICREVSSIKISGTAIAITNMIVMFGGSVSQPMLGKILDLNWAGKLVNGIRVYPIEAYQYALSVLPIGLFVALLLIYFLRESYGQAFYKDDKHETESIAG